ncbi:MAG: UvrD-helicase domain-containing protein [Synergistaceae bacterium]|jgi:ATP-dependent exoDNAse (exonuclease V) beta subunit|nr:UvrD-helicase domain-containing protein [Synergistaceae bacterium]
MTGLPNEALLRLISDARPEQREAILSRAPVTVVSAGAGTGKTHTLARRFAWLLASDPECRVDQILTLTFTKLAAEEMRERIARTLRDWCRSTPSDHLRDAVDRIDEAYISTIHSFALRVIRESGLELDVDPAASIVSEPFMREFWRDFRWNLETMSESRIAAGLSEEWRGFARDLLGDRSFASYLNFFGAGTLAIIAEESGEVFGSRNMSPSDIRPVDLEAEEDIRRRISSRLEGEWLDAWDLWYDRLFPAMSDYLGRGGGKFASAMRNLREKWSVADRTPEAARDFLLDLMYGPLSNLSGSSGLRKILASESGLDLSAWRDGMRDTADITATLLRTPPYGIAEARAREVLAGVASLGWECWNAARSESGLLSYPDLVRYAGSAIQRDRSYALRFRHIMVDEFQDTDGLQDGMIRALRDSWMASGAEASRTLFIVGDIKQSIYRFRHAKPELLADYITGSGSPGSPDVHIPLSCSYRMSGRLMEGINRVFGGVWSRGVMESDGPRLAYEPLRPPADAPWWEERNGPDAPELPLEILLLESGTGDDGDVAPAPVRRRMLADGIARRLLSMAGSCSISPDELVWDRGSCAFRRTSWNDIAVLVPARTSYQPIEEAFGEAGIPVVFGRSMGYFGRGEVQDVVNLLRLLDRPGDDFALTCWLESPFSRMSPGAGLAIAAEARGAGVDMAGLFGETYPSQASRLSRLRREAVLAGPARALLTLLEDRSWLDSYGVSLRPRVLANLRRCVEIAREYEASMGRSLPACADYLGRSMRGAAPTEEPDPIPDGRDAVRVMTVHASKGLEFPVVVIVCEGSMSGTGGRRRSACVSRNLGLVPSNVPDFDESGEPRGVPEKSATSKWHDFIESTEERREDERLMYVAMTRAQDRLVCCGISDGDTEGAPDWIGRIMASGGDAGFKVTVFSDPNEIGTATPKVPRGRGIAFPEKPREAELRGRGPWASVPRPALARFSASGHSLLSWCPVAYRRRYRQGWGMKWETSAGGGLGGADLGSLAHWVLTRWDLDPSTLAGHLPAEDELNPAARERALMSVPRFLRRAYGSAGDRAALRSWLEDFAATEECRELRFLKSRGLLRQETPFSARLGDVCLVGSIDLYWESSGRGHVRDWKITPEESAPSELYVEQVRFYSLACHLLRPELEIDAGLIYLRPGVSGASHGAFVTRDWEALSSEVEESARTAAGGHFQPRRDRCGICPFRSSCEDFIAI